MSLTHSPKKRCLLWLLRFNPLIHALIYSTNTDEHLLCTRHSSLRREEMNMQTKSPFHSSFTKEGLNSKHVRVQRGGEPSTQGHIVHQREGARAGPNPRVSESGV